MKIATTEELMELAIKAVEQMSAAAKEELRKAIGRSLQSKRRIN